MYDIPAHQLHERTASMTPSGEELTCVCVRGLACTRRGARTGTKGRHRPPRGELRLQSGQLGGRVPRHVQLRARGRRSQFLARLQLPVSQPASQPVGRSVSRSVAYSSTSVLARFSQREREREREILVARQRQTAEEEPSAREEAGRQLQYVHLGSYRIPVHAESLNTHSHQ